MHKKFDFTQTGGFPLSQDTLKYMQEGYSDLSEVLVKSLGNNVIIDLQKQGNTITSGWVVINNELLPVSKGTGDYLEVVETTENYVFEDGTPKKVKYSRVAKPGNKGTKISELKPFKQYKYELNSEGELVVNDVETNLLLGREEQGINQIYQLEINTKRGVFLLEPKRGFIDYILGRGRLGYYIVCDFDKSHVVSNDDRLEIEVWDDHIKNSIKKQVFLTEEMKGSILKGVPYMLIKQVVGFYLKPFYGINNINKKQFFLNPDPESVSFDFGVLYEDKLTAEHFPSLPLINSNNVNDPINNEFLSDDIYYTRKETHGLNNNATQILKCIGIRFISNKPRIPGLKIFKFYCDNADGQNALDISISYRFNFNSNSYEFNTIYYKRIPIPS